MGRSVFASVAVPIFPYVPPSDVMQMDLLFNIFGLTKPAIEDDVKRLQGYWALIEMVMGASAEATKSKIEQMFDNARTTRAWEIDPDTISAMNQIATGALAQGIESGGTPSITQQEQVYQFIQQKLEGTNIQLSYEQYGTFATAANGKYGVGNWVLYMCVAYHPGSTGQIALGAVSKNSATPMYYYEKGGRYNSFGNAYLNNSESAQRYYESVCSQYSIYANVATHTNTYIDQYIRTNNVYGSTFTGTYIHGDTKGNVTYASVTAQSAQIADALEQGELVPITAQTALVDGQIDKTKPAKIHLPSSLPLPAETVADLPVVQEQMGVVPISDDVSETVSELQTQQAQITGDTGAFALDLTGYFPFCIPFDIGNLLGAFVAEPEAPVIPFTFPVGYEDGQIIMETYYMDLSVFDTVAYWCRKGELALFVIGLGVVTRQWFLRG